MSPDHGVMLLGLAGGALGGAVSYLHLAFAGFKEMPTDAPAQDSGVTRQRIYFFLARLVFGAISAFIFSFWFMDAVESGGLHTSKFVFVSALIGFSTTALATASKKVGKLLG